MKFRIKDLRNYLKDKPDWEEIATQLNLKSFETVRDGKSLEIDFLPNRFSDAACLTGLAKEIEALGLGRVVTTSTKIRNSKFEIRNFVNVKLQTASCWNYFGLVILQVTNRQSPHWLKEFVEFYGFNSVNLLVDLSNFVMIELGAPAHIFDWDKIKTIKDGSGLKQIIIRASKTGETFQSLTGEKYQLPAGAVVISDREQILALGGIRGASAAPVTLATKNIFVEAAVFDPATIYKVSRGLNLKTEASYRAERYVSPYASRQALERLGGLIQQEAGGKFGGGRIEIGQWPQAVKILLPLEKIEQYSGLSLTLEQAEKILTHLGCPIVKKIKTKNSLYVQAPVRRFDLRAQEDLIEEVVRIYGWDKIKSRLPQLHLTTREDEIIVLKDLSRQIMISAGCDEVLNYSFINETDAQRFGFDLSELVEVLNPVSRVHTFARPSLWPNLLKAVKTNLKLFKELRLFEIGHSAAFGQIQGNFKSTRGHNNSPGVARRSSAFVINESNKIAFLLSLPKKMEALLEAKGLALSFLERLGLPARSQNTALPSFEASATIKGETEVEYGLIGLFNQNLTEAYGLDQGVVVGEFNLDLILKNLKEELTYQPIPEFPAVTRDISLLISETTSLDQLEEEIQTLGGPLLESVSLFDLYQDQAMGDKKSVAFRLVFRSADRSLTDGEVNRVMQKIGHTLIQRFGVAIR